MLSKSKAWKSKKNSQMKGMYLKWAPTGNATFFLLLCLEILYIT